MKHLFKFIVALGVFTMMIGSGFAMDNNPPTEPVKKAVVETEAVEEAPQQVLMGYGYYNHITKECVFDSAVPPIDCSITNTGLQCTINIGGINYLMFLVVRTSVSDPWVCTIPLKKPRVPIN